MPLKVVCTVERIIDHTEQVYTVFLRSSRPVPPFRAGQFLHLALDHYDPSQFWPESRAFSIASSPTRRNELRITYSVRGAYTARMERELAPGRRVWVKMPYGHFIVEGTNVVLLAGGTGITPFTAFLESLLPSDDRSVLIAYGARSPKLLVYREFIDCCAARVGYVQSSYFVEDHAHLQGEARSEQRLVVGRIELAAVWPSIKRPFNATYYIAGPPVMLNDLSRDLQLRGIPQEQIRIDSWE